MLFFPLVNLFKYHHNSYKLAELIENKPLGLKYQESQLVKKQRREWGKSLTKIT
jgi:hypothetical protein